MGSGVLPGLLISSGDGEGLAIASGGQRSDLVGIQSQGDVTSRPGDVAVVGGGKGDAAIGIAITPGDVAGGIELSSAISFCEGSRFGDGRDFRLVIGAGDGDHHILGIGLAKAVAQREGVGKNQRFANSEVVKTFTARVKVPVELTGGGVIGEHFSRHYLQHGAQCLCI